VAKYRAAGGVDPDGATSQQIGVWMSQKEHEGLRKEWTPLCEARQKTAPTEWMNSDEGRICTGVVEANFFTPSEINRKGTSF
jgi:hypothetical protein